MGVARRAGGDHAGQGRTPPPWRAALAGMVALLFACLALPALAQTETAEPPEVAELRRLLASPAVQAWIAEAPAPAPEVSASADLVTMAAERMAAQRLVLAESPKLPGEIWLALTRLTDEIRGFGILMVALMVTVLILVGLAAEWRFLRVTRNMRKSVLGSSEDTVGERVRKLGGRLALTAAALGVFALATLGVLALLPLPELAHAVAFRLLAAALMFRGTLMLLRLNLAPGAPERRVVPMPDAMAAFWLPRLATLAGIVIGGWATVWLFRLLDMPAMQLKLLPLIFGCALGLTALVFIWQRHGRDLGTPPPSFAASVGWSAYVVVTFVLWFIGLVNHMSLLLIGGLLLLAISISKRAVNHLLRETPDVEGTGTTKPPSVLAAVIERGARSVLILSAGALLMWAWGVSLTELLAGEVRGAGVIRAIIYLVFVVSIFDFIWHVTRTAIDTYIDAAPEEDGTAEERRRRARLRTVLPMVRSTLQVTLAVIAVLMVLSALGLNVGPLIAGAGVLGAAIAFGSQSLVRDVVSGVFYLLDDAFRVGEYIIVSGAKGTVESFSLRSVQLRHHRGPVYTIPFGSLGAIQNVSRDWVIEKMAITVVYGSDLAKIKKVVKGVSAELMADPELAPGFLEPLKSQGADALSDHGIIVRIKFMAKPGSQFGIRRRANALLEQRFKENGIQLAYPTVRVVGHDEDDEVDAAAAEAAIIAAQQKSLAAPA